MNLSPEKVSSSLTKDESKLYELIWKRTVASQMSPAQILHKTVIIKAGGPNNTAKLSTSYSEFQFDGFQILYPDRKKSFVTSTTPILINKNFDGNLSITIEKQYTQPPERFNEASLIKKMSELGIGRPSNIASTIQSLCDKENIKTENLVLTPTDKGRIIITFLNLFCPKLVDPSYTANINHQLDLISDGKLGYEDFLIEFWRDFSNTIKAVQEVDNHDIIETINDNLSPVVFPGKDDGTDPRSCPKCGSGKLSLRFSRVGTYVACSNSPDCRYTRQLGHVETDFNSSSTKEPTRVLGNDPDSGLQVSIKDGRYGLFVQLGIGSNPKRVTLPPNWGFENVDLETAINFLALPREVGTHPDTGHPIHAGIGRFGPFVLHNSVYSKLNSVNDAFTVDLAGAVQAITRNMERKPKRQTSNNETRQLGNHSNGGSILLIKGRLGPFLKYGHDNIKLPKSLDPKSITLEQAIQIIDQNSNSEDCSNISNQY